MIREKSNVGRLTLYISSIVIFSFTTFLHALPATAPVAAPATTQATTQTADQHMPLRFDDGYDTDPRDHGRPVVLIANALGVTPEVFRDAFSGVHPAGPNSGGPTPDEARANKRVLLEKLAPYGVTNDRLDEVSNYYRYRRNEGELWKHKPAAGFAIVHDGAVISVTITDAGAGYTTPPTVTVPAMQGVQLTATLSFGTDLHANGSVKSIVVEPIPVMPPPNRTSGP